MKMGSVFFDKCGSWPSTLTKDRLGSPTHIISDGSSECISRHCSARRPPHFLPLLPVIADSLYHSPTAQAYPLLSGCAERKGQWSFGARRSVGVIRTHPLSAN